jgi:P-type Ca2+ transporter type 2C
LLGVVDGEGVLLVKRVGSSTLYGSVADALQESSDRESPLQIKLGSLAETISRLGYIGASCIAVSFMFKQIILDNHWSWREISAYLGAGGPFIHDIVKAVILAIIVIVVAVPEGLPMMIAIVLSLNMRRLLKDKVLVRKLLGIETAGSMSILFADKTGTMTKGQFDPCLFLSGSGLSYRAMRELPASLAESLAFAIRESSESIVDAKSGDIVGGNASDQAMLRFLPRDVLLTQLDVEDEKHIMFNATRKFSAVQMRLGPRAAKHLSSLIRFDADARVTLVKGAPEIILPLCNTYYDSNGSAAPLSPNLDSLQKEIDLASRRGIRVIAIATTLDHIVSEQEAEAPPQDLTLIGIIGIRDEVRPSTMRAIDEARRAGIQSVMITGDKKETAVAVAVEVGLIDQRNLNDPGAVLTSSDLKRMSDAEVQDIIPKLRVVARALPTDKARLVNCAQGKCRVAKSVIQQVLF